MRSLSVFYADDDEDDLMLFEDAINDVRQLIAAAVSLHLVKNGVKLIDKILQEKVADPLIFLDLNMPCKSGLELLQEIRANSLLKNSTVIIYSTSTNDESIRKSYQYGASLYACKPNDYTSLKTMTTSLLTTDWQSRTSDFSNFVYQKAD